MEFNIPRGMNFDSSTTFNCKGTEYVLTILIGVPTGNDFKIHVVDSSKLGKFEFSSEANNLCMSGTLVVIDTDGEVGNFYNTSPCVVGVAITESTKLGSAKNDGDFSSSSSGMNSSSGFKHMFLVDKISILGRQQNAVVYEFKLTSIMWTRMISTPRYSNFKSKEDTKIMDIMKDVLGTAFEDLNVFDGQKVVVNKDSFEKMYASDPPVLNNYITFANDSVFDVLRYLQSRLYFCGDDNSTAATGLSYLNYNWLTGEIEVVDFDGTYIQPSRFGQTVVSLDGKTFEQLISGKEQGFMSVSKTGFLPFIMNFFGYDVYNFKTEYKNVITDIASTQISEFFNQKTLKFERNNKFDVNLLKEFLFGENGIFPISINYSRQYSSSYLNDTTFQALLESLLTRDVLVFETIGDLSHMPGMIYTIAGKNRPEGGDSPSLENDLNQNILGLFHVVKTVHTIVPISRSDGETYREKLYLVKTWSPR